MALVSVMLLLLLLLLLQLLLLRMGVGSSRELRQGSESDEASDAAKESSASAVEARCGCLLFRRCRRRDVFGVIVDQSINRNFKKDF